MPKFTPGPWKWGSDWNTFKANHADEFDGDKYADLQLFGPDSQEVIPIRVDHYEPIWDVDLTTEHMPSKADRDLIAAAPELLEACKYALRCLNRHEAPDGMIGVETRNMLGSAIKKAKGE